MHEIQLDEGENWQNTDDVSDMYIYAVTIKMFNNIKLLSMTN